MYEGQEAGLINSSEALPNCERDEILRKLKNPKQTLLITLQ